MIHSIYLVFSSLEIERKLIQTKVYYNFFTVRMKTTFKPSKIAAAKILFSNVYFIDTTCPD